MITSHPGTAVVRPRPSWMSLKWVLFIMCKLSVWVLTPLGCGAVVTGTESQFYIIRWGCAHGDVSIDFTTKVYRVKCVHAHREINWNSPMWGIFSVGVTSGYRPRLECDHCCYAAPKVGHWKQQMCKEFRCLNFVVFMVFVECGRILWVTRVRCKLLGSGVQSLEQIPN